MQLIPKEVTSRGRQWINGKEATCITKKGTWKVRIVLSNRVGKFSTGWIKLVKDNGLKAGQTLVFELIQKSGRIVFNVKK